MRAVIRICQSQRGFRLVKHPVVGKIGEMVKAVDDKYLTYGTEQEAERRP